MGYPTDATFGPVAALKTAANIRAYHLEPVEEAELLQVKVSATVITPFGSQTFYQKFTAADLVTLANLVVTWLGATALSFRVPVGAGGTAEVRASTAAAILAAGGYIQAPP